MGGSQHNWNFGGTAALLLELGLLTEITPPLAPDAIPKDRRPIPIEGKPISELIIEERR